MSAWFQQHRVEWIAESVLIFGFINREHIAKKFGVSIPQASLDINLVIKTYPGLLAYNASAKRYELAADHTAAPRWSPPSVARIRSAMDGDQEAMPATGQPPVGMASPLEDDGCPKNDPECLGNNGDCHDACEWPLGAASSADEFVARFFAKMEPPLNEREKTIAAMAIGYATARPAAVTEADEAELLTIAYMQGAHDAVHGGGKIKFPLKSRVTKIRGSSWTGRVVGFYTTSLTPVGYSVESENEPGSVQVWPEAALAFADIPESYDGDRP